MAEKHYVRLWLSAMFLKDDSKLFRSYVPVVHSAVTLQFADKPAQELPYVAGPQNLGLGQKLGRVRTRGAGATNVTIDGINNAIPDSFGWGPLKVDIPDNPIPHLPTFHEGGVFRAPGGRGEGLALLRDREVVFTPEQMMALRGAGGGTNITVNASGSNLKPQDIAREVAWQMRTRGR